MKRAIKKSKTDSELYYNINESILFLIGYGYDYAQVMEWNIGGFFFALDSVTKLAKAKSQTQFRQK